MSLSPPSGISLRPTLPGDIGRLAAIVREAIEVSAADDYDVDQRAAWASMVDDEATFGARIEHCVTLVAEAGGSPVGFIALKGNDTIDLLYVSPSHGRRAVATFLCQAIELLAGGRKSSTLTVEASDTLHPLLMRLGYTPMQRNTVSLHGQWLANTTMRKTLTPAGSGEQ